MKYQLHVSRVVQDKEGRCAGLHQLFHVADEFLADPCLGCDCGASTTQRGAKGGGSQWSGEHDPSEEACSRATQDIRDCREWLSVNGERSIEMSHNYSHIKEDKVVLVPSQPGNL